MVPAASCPGVTTSSEVLSEPSSRWTSDRQMPQAATRTTTSCGAGAGTGTVVIANPRSARVNRAARMVGGRVSMLGMRWMVSGPA